MYEKQQLLNSFESNINNKIKLFTQEKVGKLSESDQELSDSEDASLNFTKNLNASPKILIVSDKTDIISITKSALKNFTYKGNKLQFIEAQSYDEATIIIKKESDIALIFLDVIMKNLNDGLVLVKYIRSVLKNNFVQIILRTDQIKYDAKKELVENNNVNFYHAKLDINNQKLLTLTTSCLRSYYAIKKVCIRSRHLEKELTYKTNQLVQKNIELEKINETKNKMLSIIAHDLVNPFSSLIGYSEMLKDSCHTLSPDKIQIFADILYETSNNTYNLLNNLLHWLSSQTGNIVYKPEQTDLNRLIRQNVELLRNQASKKSLELIYDSTKPSHAYCDLNMTSTIIRNLISNAIKFTKKGNVTIKTDTESTYTIVTIEDTGLGMNSETIKNLFSTKNFSADGTSGEKGTGLGLMLCKEFVDKNKGDISVESKLKKGSKFTIKIPSEK